ncbi:MAG TPA: ABC transporter ATP-binding protein [Calditrichia bacterium]|nr:ABC transporter ATP-binding protein [Calditrichota bacterium]HQV32118.1 ABC transporter ATP-binding protein [Calditrichia bacterium]
MNEIAVQTQNLTRRFGKFTAVDRLTITVSRGEIFGFLGANGAGKTTAIRMLCGLLLPSEGEATVAGFDVYKSSEAIKKNIGYMSQRFSLYDDLTISENIDFFGGVYGLSPALIEERKEALIEQVGLGDFRKRLTRDLPLGFKQRLALGSAMLHDPPIIFLDEPTSGVDPRARREFWSIINELAAAGKTVFVTTHFMDEAEYCHRVSIMRAGKLIALDSPGKLKESYGRNNMQDVFVALVNDEDPRPEEQL